MILARAELCELDPGAKPFVLTLEALAIGEGGMCWTLQRRNWCRKPSLDLVKMDARDSTLHGRGFLVQVVKVALAANILVQETLEEWRAGWRDPILTWRRHWVFFVRSNRLCVPLIENLFETGKVFPNSADKKDQLKKWREDKLSLVRGLWQACCREETNCWVLFLKEMLHALCKWQTNVSIKHTKTESHIHWTSGE